MCSCISGGNPDGTKKSSSIDRGIEEDKKAMANFVKLLLLGAGESGKSTIAKQMKIIHLHGFTEEERASFKSIIASNVVGSIKALVEATTNLKIQTSSENDGIKKRVLSEDYFANAALSKEIASDIKKLWKDSGILQAFKRSAEFQLNDSAEYFFTNIDRISEPNYIPTEQDVLRCRARTTGIIETEFSVGKTKFNLVDVGGQRSERRKWLHCFTEVTAVIFVVALSEYDQKLYEDESTNRMHEALKLFKDICNTKWFIDTSILLFLNKKDLFAKKIETVPLSVCFPDYRGGNSFGETTQYIQDQFLAQNENPKKLIYPHQTCATDTDNINIVFKAVQDIILNKLLDKQVA